MDSIEVFWQLSWSRVLRWILPRGRPEEASLHTVPVKPYRDTPISQQAEHRGWHSLSQHGRMIAPRRSLPSLPLITASVERSQRPPVEAQFPESIKGLATLPPLPLWHSGSGNPSREGARILFCVEYVPTVPWLQWTRGWSRFYNVQGYFLDSSGKPVKIAHTSNVIYSDYTEWPIQILTV